MSNKRSASRLESSGHPTSGARFFKADLHVHTPASHDFGDKKATPAEFIHTAEQAALDIVAVTDHNSANWVDPLRKASKGSTLSIIPGVEISTPEGHIIALFETDYEAGKIGDLLVNTGIPRDKHGQEDAISKDHAEQVIKKVHDHGGLAIAAHANSSNGLLKAKGQYKLGLVPMPELAAIELSKQDEIERFCAGQVSPEYPPKACTQSSDSHSLAELARRTVYLKMHEPSLWGIRQALLDYEVKVRFPWNYVEATHPRIMSLAVDQGFFGGQQFIFHEGLNCLVGGQGTGKSTVVELLRHCFDSSPQFEHSRADHESKIQSLVGEGGLIQVRYVDYDGEEKTVSREVQPWTTSREVRDSTGNPTSLQASPAFFSQGELVEIARSPIAQLDLLDRHLDLDTENEAEREVVDSLRASADTLVALQRKERNLREEIDHLETGLAATSAKYGRLERQLEEPILKEFPLWEAEQTYLRDLQEALRRVPAQMKELLADFDLEGLRLDLPEGTPNSVDLRPLASMAGRVEALLGGIESHFRSGVKELEKEVREVSGKWKPRFAAKKAGHEQFLRLLGAVDTRKANAQFRSLGKRLETLRRNERELARARESLGKAAKERARLLARLAQARDSRWRKRSSKGSEFAARLGDVIHIRLISNGERSAFEQRIRELSRRGYLKEPQIRQIAAAIAPSTLLQHVLNRDADKIAQATNVTREVAERLVEHFHEKEPAELYELESVPLPDLPEIQYVVAPGRQKPLSELSTGQKGTVIVSLAMVEGRGPLVIDHPEEPLDTQSIYRHVVQTLRKNKGSRQFIFTTHNPNIAVGADAELSHILDADADRGTIQTAGAVDHEETNRLLLLHLEGGPEALQRRIQKYRPRV